MYLHGDKSDQSWSLGTKFEKIFQPTREQSNLKYVFMNLNSRSHIVICKLHHTQKDAREEKKHQKLQYVTSYGWTPFLCDIYNFKILK
jgi:hypothetical protein